jgi:WD40 repeat protein
MFPDFHRDLIRELAVNQVQRNLILSGGFDGNVFVTDIEKLLTDMRRNERRSENSLYACRFASVLRCRLGLLQLTRLCRDVVGSVRWVPESPVLASCTADIGMFHLFDIRAGPAPQPVSPNNYSGTQPVVFNTGKAELFSHTYLSPTYASAKSAEWSLTRCRRVLLGYGDGTVQLLDLRYRAMYASSSCRLCVLTLPDRTASFRDPRVQLVGDFKSSRDGRLLAVTGHPGYAIQLHASRLC